MLDRNVIWDAYSKLHQKYPNPNSPEKINFYQENSDKIRLTPSHQDPLVAIIICAHNEQNYLPRALAAINQSVGQSNTPLTEVIVVDNKSNDDTPQIAQAFGAKTISEPIKGIGRARQTGLEATSPSVEMVITSDADSVIPINIITSYLAILADQSIAAAYGSTEYRADIPSPPIYQLELMCYQYLAQIWLHQVKRNQPHPTSANLCFRKTSALNVGGYDVLSNKGEDFSLIRKIRSQGKTVFVPELQVTTSDRRIRQRGLLKSFIYASKYDLKIPGTPPPSIANSNDFR